MASDDPPFLKVGTEVSAKFKGAFCEARVKKVFKTIKFKVLLKEHPGGTHTMDESHLRGDAVYELNQLVEVQHGGKVVRGQILNIKDYSTYDVVFDDGDEKRLKRTQMVLKGAKHYNEEHSLDALPLYNPEQFSSPVVAKIIKKNKLENRREREARSVANTPRKEHPRHDHSGNYSDDEKPSSSRGSRMATRGKTPAKTEKKAEEEDRRKWLLKKKLLARKAKEAVKEAEKTSNVGVSSEDEDGSESGSDSDRETSEEEEEKPERLREKSTRSDTSRTPTKEKAAERQRGKEEEPTKREKSKFYPGDVVLVFSDAKKTGASVPAVVVNQKIYKNMPAAKNRPLLPSELPVRGFLNEGRYFTASTSSLKLYTGGPLTIEKESMRSAFAKAKDFHDSNGKTLPASWDLNKHILADGAMRKAEKPEKPEKPKPEKQEKAEKAEKPEKPEKSEKTEKSEKKPEKKEEKQDQSDSTSSSESDEEESSDDETDKEFGEARDAFVAHFYKFQEENATPINKQPVLGGKPLDIYRFYRVVRRLGGYKQVCTKNKWKKVLIHMKLEGCPGATAVTVKNAYNRYLLSFSQQYTRLGWSLNELTMPEGKRAGRAVQRINPSEKKPKKDDKEKRRKEGSREKESSVASNRTDEPIVEKTPKLEPDAVDEKPPRDADKAEKSEPRREKDKDVVSKDKVKREHPSPSPARSTASSASKDDEARRQKVSKGKSVAREAREHGREREREKESPKPAQLQATTPNIEQPVTLKRSDSTARDRKRERSVARELTAQRRERKRTDSLSTTSDEESRKRKEKRKSFSLHPGGPSGSSGPGLGPKEKSVERERGGPLASAILDANQPIQEDTETGYLHSHLLCQFRQGQNVRALHCGSWYMARVLTSETPKVDQLVSMLKAKGGETGLSAEAIVALRDAIKKAGAFVHYLGWNSRYDEFIPLHMIRVTIKDEEESRNKTIAAIGDKLPAERIQLFQEWSSSPEGMELFRQCPVDEKKSFLQTIGPYRPRRFSITQVEQISESLQLKNMQQREEPTSGDQPALLAAGPPTQQRSTPSPSKMVPTASGTPQKTNTVVGSVPTTVASTPTGLQTPKEEAKEEVAMKMRMRTPVKEIPQQAAKDKDSRVAQPASTAPKKEEKPASGKPKPSEDAEANRLREEKARKEAEEKLKEEDKKRKEAEKRKQEEEEAMERERRETEERAEKERAEREEREKRQREEEEAEKRKAEERKAREAAEQPESPEKADAKEEPPIKRRRGEERAASVKSSTTSSESRPQISPRRAPRREEMEEEEEGADDEREEMDEGDGGEDREEETDRLVQEAKELCATTRRRAAAAAAAADAPETPSGANTPTREENEDDKWSISDQSGAGTTGSAGVSPRGYRGKRKRLLGRQPLNLKKKREEEEKPLENEDDDSDSDEVTITKDTFTSIRKGLLKTLETDGTLDDYRILGLDALPWDYDHVPQNLPEARQIYEYVLHRMYDLRQLYDESRAHVLRLNRQINESRLKQKKAERAEEKAALMCGEKPANLSADAPPDASAPSAEAPKTAEVPVQA